MARIKEEIEQWRTLALTMEQRAAALETSLAELQAKPQMDPDRTAALEQQITELREQIAELKKTPTPPPSLPKSGEEKPSLETPPVTSLDPPVVPAPVAQTKASKRGWI